MVTRHITPISYYYSPVHMVTNKQKKMHSPMAERGQRVAVDGWTRTIGGGHYEWQWDSWLEIDNLS